VFISFIENSLSRSCGFEVNDATGQH